jgi:multidrug transporter EmrE-like cation transporter
MPVVISLIVLTVILNTAAQGLLKAGSDQNPINVYLMGGILFYGLSTIVYIVVLGKFNLSVAYPVIIGLTVISTTALGAIIFKEQVSPIQWLGIGLMLSGISAISLGKTT